MPTPSDARIPWRGALVLAPAAIVLLLWSGAIGLFALIAPGVVRPRLGRWVRPWGRFGLAAFGVRVDLEGVEHLRADEPRLVLFNHVNVLDILLMASIAPDRPLVLYKRELGRVPLLGWAFRATGMIAVDRSDHERAVASVAEAGRRIHAERGAVIMSPEGTRSRDGVLLPFKLGAFHLACSTGVPLVLLVLRGLEHRLPPGAWFVRPGALCVRALPPIDTSAWTPEEVRERADEVRARFLAELGQAASTGDDGAPLSREAAAR